MRELTSAELKALLLEILIFIDKFCQENNIQYSLDGGTLIGAVRHKGFIPWDDDIDIMMLRHDYEKFIKLFNNQSGIYKIQCYETDKSTEFLFAKVYDTRTILYEYGVDNGFGIAVDIFPVDGFNIKKNIYNYSKKIKIIRGLLLIKKYGQKRDKFNHFVYRLIKFFIKPVSIKTVGALSRNLIKKYKCTDSFYVCQLCGYEPEKQIYPVSLFKKHRNIEFEGYYFKAIQNYDIYLSSLYDDYMKLPPMEEQAAKHFAQGFLR
ncbi:LPS cholinephosphotransferase [Spirochaetia bacterium]|nr:LPS cholinephosphotransferase [Spirochaetia bacterium]